MRSSFHVHKTFVSNLLATMFKDIDETNCSRGLRVHERVFIGDLIEVCMSPIGCFHERGHYVLSSSNFSSMRRVEAIFFEQVRSLKKIVSI